jgi:hypothetical protein
LFTDHNIKFLFHDASWFLFDCNKNIFIQVSDFPFSVPEQDGVFYFELLVAVFIINKKAIAPIITVSFEL